jgi:hypothetical protein
MIGITVAAFGGAIFFVALAAFAASKGYALGEKQTSAKQIATSSGGTVVQGWVDNAGPGPEGPRSFRLVFVAPSGTITGTGPLDAGDPADLRKAWVALDESTAHGNLANGLSPCNAFANPANLSTSFDGVWDFRISFDVRCPNDGLGYQFYRVFVDGDPRSWAHWTSWITPDSFGTVSGGGGDGTLASARMEDTQWVYSRQQYGFMRICGYDGSRFSCWGEDVNATTSTPTSPKVTAIISYADSITADERPL